MKAKKAIVRAAGFGTRLRPRTCAVPKPLLPVWSEPMLSRMVALLREWGVEEIAVNCHYLHSQVESWCAENGCRVSVEGEILGTGGALNPLREWLGGDDFYLVNGDVVVEGFRGFGEIGQLGGEMIGCCLVTEDGPRTIEADPQGHVTCWKSPDPGFPGTYTYCGVALLKSGILDYVEPTGFSTIVSAYERAMQDGLFMKAVNPDGVLWTDAGTIDSYMAVNEAGGENAYADIPQLRAVGAKDVKFLGARGSDRCFFEADGRIAIVYDDERRGENARYASHARWLRGKGVPVPEILADVPEMKTLAMSHAGAERKMSVDDYVRVVEALARFNALDASALSLEPPFDAALWEWERNLFAEHCLGSRFAMECPAAAMDELVKVAKLLDCEPKALVHRDFQSTNILWKGDDFAFIDFQGMRLGPAAYDLASLLYDPHLRLSQGDRRLLAGVYAQQCGREGIVKILPYAAVERLVQCLGAYGRLASVGKPEFGRFVMPALENLLAAADEAGLDAVGALAEDLIAKEAARQKAAEHGHHHHHEGCMCGCHGEAPEGGAR